MKRAIAAVLVVGSLLALCPAGFAAQIKVAVKSEAEVSGPRLTLGDIAVISGEVPGRVKALRELGLGEAPPPGATAFLTPQTLEPRLSANRADFSSIEWRVPAQIKITTRSQPVSGQKIVDAARTYLVGAALGAEIIHVKWPNDILAPVGKLELLPEVYGTVRYNVPTTVNVTIRTDDRTFLKVPVQFEVRRYLDVVVAAVNLNAGDILSEAALRLERMDAGKMPAGYLTDPGKAVGKQVRYALPPGSVISERAIARPILIKRGEIVRIAARIGGIEAFANGVAFTPGAAGDLIRVQNTTTKKFLTGRVQDDKSVLVINQPGG